MLENVKVLIHSCIRIQGSRVLYFDPFKLNTDYKDGDIIFSTHNHYDHFSPEDIIKVAKKDSILVQPEYDKAEGEKLGFTGNRHVCMAPGEVVRVDGIKISAVAAYTPGRNEFHPKYKNWLGYIVEMDGVSYYVTGDTYDVPEVRMQKADVVIIPVGGTYTFNAEEAAAVVNHIRPKAAVPTHYGCLVGSEEDAGRFISLLDSGIYGKIIMQHD